MWISVYVFWMLCFFEDFVFWTILSLT